MKTDTKQRNKLGMPFADPLG